jgi:glutaminyl-tRNA synthetase
MSEDKKALNFIEEIVETDLNNGLSQDKLRFRFPPEPNGYLHIGHAASICLNFGLGLKYNAPVNLRFDDTNPAKEEQEYVDAIKNDIKWLGFNWDKELYSSDYFQQLYDWAYEMIQNGKAYIDEQTASEIAEQKGTPTQVGSDSPYRYRPIAENLEIFERMKNGDYEEGTHVLRAKIDMTSPNMLMRDPIMYRILKKSHHRTGDSWNIYPMYDWTHGESDYLEQISHSICTLEFKSHRELYDWFLDKVYDKSTLALRPKQREFARRNLSYTVMSKRKLLQLVENKVVNGWDDPRMPTISGLRRRGYTAASIRNFSDLSGISKRDNVTDVALLEFCIKDDLNKTAPRVMAVLNPVKVVITNYPEGKEEWLDAENNPEDENAGDRKVPFSREIYIEQEDFREQANKKFFRLKLGKEVRLKNAYIIQANDVVKDEQGNITEIHCTYDEDSRSGSGTEASKRRVKGTLHWVSIPHAVEAEVRIYDRLFTDEAPDGHKEKDFMEFINPDSLKVSTAYVEPSLKEAKIADHFQFQRLGYFNVDNDSTAEKLVFNRTVALKDSWAKIEKKANRQQTQTSNTLAEIYTAAGKYLKAREEDERQSLEAKLYELSEKSSSEELLALLPNATSNKEFLAYLFMLNSKKIPLDFDNTSNFDNANAFLSKAISMKNSYVRYRAVDFINKYTMFQDKYLDLLKTMAVEDKNTKIVALINTML